MTKLSKTSNVLLVFLAIILIGLADEALARAGGGGGSRGGGLLSLILAPFFMIYSAIVTYLAYRKNKECKALMSRIAKIDSVWDRDSIRSRIEIVFFKVQEAWMMRDQSIARDYMTDRLYEKHKSQTDLMKAQGRQNILENINLLDFKVVQISDFEDDSKDSFWAYIKGSMIDYTVDETSWKIISGRDDRNETFKELWKFRRTGNQWMLDEIDQEAEIGDLKNFTSFSEEI